MSHLTVAFAPTVRDLHSRILHTTDRPQLQNMGCQLLLDNLSSKAKLLSQRTGTDFLSQEEFNCYESLRSLIDTAGKVQTSILKNLQETVLSLNEKFPKPPISINIQPSVDDLSSYIFYLLVRPDFKDPKNSSLREALSDKARVLSSRIGTELLSPESFSFYTNLRQLIDKDNQIDQELAKKFTTIREALQTPQKATPKRTLPQDTPAKRQKIETPSTPLWPSTPKTAQTPAKKQPLPSIAMFGPDAYERHLGKIESAPSLPSNLETILKETCPFHKDKQVGETHILRLVVPTINGKSMILQDQRTLFTKFKVESYMTSEVLKQYGETNISSAQWILVTKEPIPETQGKTRKEQEAVLAQYPSYRMGTTLEMVFSFLSHCAMTISRERLCAGMYTRVQEPGMVTGQFNDFSLYCGEFSDESNIETISLFGVRELIS